MPPISRSSSRSSRLLDYFDRQQRADAADERNQLGYDRLQFDKDRTDADRDLKVQGLDIRRLTAEQAAQNADAREKMANRLADIKDAQLKMQEKASDLALKQKELAITKAQNDLDKQTKIANDAIGFMSAVNKIDKSKPDAPDKLTKASIDFPSAHFHPAVQEEDKKIREELKHYQKVNEVDAQRKIQEAQLQAARDKGLVDTKVTIAGQTLEVPKPPNLGTKTTETLVGDKQKETTRVPITAPVIPAPAVVPATPAGLPAATPAPVVPVAVPNGELLPQPPAEGINANEFMQTNHPMAPLAVKALASPLASPEHKAKAREILGITDASQ